MRLLGLCCLLVWTVLAMPTFCFAEDGKIDIHASKVTKLVDYAFKIYNLELEFIEQYQSALNHFSREAGENLFSELFNDPIRLLQQLLLLDQNNAKARLYLGKAFQKKAYEGEGRWNKDLAVKAEEQYRFIMGLSKKNRIDAEILQQASIELAELDKILRRK